MERPKGSVVKVSTIAPNVQGDGRVSNTKTFDTATAANISSGIIFKNEFFIFTSYVVLHAIASDQHGHTRASPAIILQIRRSANKMHGWVQASITPHFKQLPLPVLNAACRV
jgi:hypothetical protein